MQRHIRKNQDYYSQTGRYTLHLLASLLTKGQRNWFKIMLIRKGKQINTPPPWPGECYILQQLLILEENIFISMFTMNIFDINKVLK